MERIGSIWLKFTGGKKLRKDQLLIIILAGILFCVIAIPAGNEKSPRSAIQYGLSDSGNAIVSERDNSEIKEAEGDNPGVGYNTSYGAYWEDKLENSLSALDGAGKVKVLITLKESEERILAKDTPLVSSSTVEKDAQGGARTVLEDRQEESTIYTVNASGREVPYVSKIIQPVVEGVVVLAQGGEDAEVRRNIIETIQVLFGIDANKIRVVKMKPK